jgi:hypothetical protein
MSIDELNTWREAVRESFAKLAEESTRIAQRQIEIKLEQSKLLGTYEVINKWIESLGVELVQPNEASSRGSSESSQ